MTGSLRPIRSDVDENLSNWYRTNSRVYVAHDHACWSDPKLETKVKKKRFGTVLQSPETGLAAMMRRHAAEVQEFIAGRCVLGGGGGTGGESTEEDNLGGGGGGTRTGARAV